MPAASFTNLVGCRVPLQLAGMPSIVTPELAIAVADAGALAMVSGVMVPPPALGPMLDAVTSRTQGKVGINFLMPFLDRDAVAVAAAHACVVEFFYGEPEADLVRMVHDAGALASWQVGSREEAEAAIRAGADLIVAQGTEAGGHVRGELPLRTLLARVLEVVDVPVIAAGGIGTPRQMAAALAAGASAVRVGTRFVAARESGAHPDYVRALVAARAEDTVLTEAFGVGWENAPHRVLRSCVEAAARFGDGEVVAQDTIGGMPMPLVRFAPPAPSREATGEIAATALYAGYSVDAVERVESAADIVRELCDGAESLLRSARSQEG